MLVTLRQIVQEVGTAKHLDDALNIIVHRVKAALPIDACAVYLTDVESNQYVLMAADGFNPASIGEVRIDRQEGLLGLVGKRRELIYCVGRGGPPTLPPVFCNGRSALSLLSRCAADPLSPSPGRAGCLETGTWPIRQGRGHVFHHDCRTTGKGYPRRFGCRRSQQDAERRVAGCRLHPGDSDGCRRGHRHCRTARSTGQAGIDTGSSGPGHRCRRDRLQDRGCRRS